MQKYLGIGRHKAEDEDGPERGHLRVLSSEHVTPTGFRGRRPPYPIPEAAEKFSKVHENFVPAWATALVSNSHQSVLRLSDTSFLAGLVLW